MPYLASEVPALRWRCGLFDRAGGNLTIGAGSGADSLVEQSVEQHASGFRVLRVEPERELVEVEVELPGMHRSLMGAEQPALEERSDTMHMREEIRRGLR